MQIPFAVRVIGTILRRILLGLSCLAGFVAFMVLVIWSSVNYPAVATVMGWLAGIVLIVFAILLILMQVESAVQELKQKDRKRNKS